MLDDCLRVLGQQLTQSKALTNTDDDPARHEHADVALRRECLQNRRNDDKNGADAHSCAATKVIGDGSTEEETRDDGTDGVDCVDETDHVVVGVVEPILPILRTLHSVVDGGIVSV